MYCPVAILLNSRTKADADRLMRETGAAAAMSAEALLANPMLFSDVEFSCFDAARQYLSLASDPSLAPPPPVAWARAHVVAMLRAPMTAHPTSATLVDEATTLAELAAAVDRLDRDTIGQAALRPCQPPNRRRGPAPAPASAPASAPVFAPVSAASASTVAPLDAPASGAAGATSGDVLAKARSARGRRERHLLKIARAAASRAKRQDPSSTAKH